MKYHVTIMNTVPCLILEQNMSRHEDVLSKKLGYHAVSCLQDEQFCLDLKASLEKRLTSSCSEGINLPILCQTTMYLSFHVANSAQFPT